MEMLKIIVSIALIAICSYLLCLVNLRKNRRHNQGILPIILTVYSVVMASVMYKNVDKLVEAAEQEAYMQFSHIFLTNIIVFATCILVKVIVLLFLKAQQNTTLFVDKFYEYDEDYHEWFLLDCWCNVRKLFRQFSVIYVIFTGGFLAITWIYGKETSAWVYLTPVVLLVAVIEIYNFLNGYTKVEFEHEIGGVGAHSERISNFYRIRDVLEKLFPGEVLAAYTGCEFTQQKEITSFLKKLEESDSSVDEITAEFFSMREGKEKYDVDCIQAVTKLMKKQNVIFLNPFYKDLGKYLVLPVINALVSNQNCLIILGRNSAKQDVKKWLEKLIKDYCKVDSIWRVGELTKEANDCELGIVGFSELYDIKVIEENKEFLSKTGFVLILEPSLVINTGQIAFSIIAEQMREAGLDPVYCISDRMVEGLVDTMSHLLRERITEVVAPPVPRYIYTGISWNADGDYLRQSLFEKQTRYLGNGFELAAVAVKNQIPEVTWISETKAPIKDLKWIVGQYYTSLCKYMNLPAQQQSIYDKIKFESSMWSLEQKKEQFLIADDEFCNMFAMMRTYLSRARQQVFVNVLSENYLLRDYMRCNSQMFTTNANVIPSIVPDYAKTERNTIIKLLFMMAYKPVSQKEIKKELDLIGYPSEDVFRSLCTLVEQYTFAKEPIFVINSVQKDDGRTGIETELYYSISKTGFETYLQKTLTNAYYVVENEDMHVECINAKLFHQVLQTVLPGQFIVYDGKYYSVKDVSVKSGVILRRAADLYDGRKYYRQLRKYTIINNQEKIINYIKIMDVEIATLSVDLHVDTNGYLEMDSNNNLKTAKEISLQYQKTADELARDYKNKNILRIHLPDTTSHERFTICLLLMEMFRTIFPNTWHYLSVMAVRPDDIEGMLNYMVYELHGDVEDDYIYIVEDSDMDLGLLEAIEKNFMRFLEILSDFILWHFEKMREPAYKDPVKKEIVMPEDQKRKKGIVRILEKIARIFGVKKEEELKIDEPNSTEESEKPREEAKEEVKEEEKEAAEEYTLEESDGTENAEDIPVEEPISEETQVETLGEMLENSDEDSKADSNEDSNENPEMELGPVSMEELGEETESDSEDVFEVSSEEKSDVIDIDGTDIFDEESDPIHDIYFEECFNALGINARAVTRYQKECYLKFGFDEIDHRIDLEGVRKYLGTRGFGKGDLTKARRRELYTDTILDLEAENRCDFCGIPISGVSYEKMNDGRIRCNDCGATAINTVDEFRKIFQHILTTMQSFYGIEYKVAIGVKMADAHEVNRGIGQIFKPSKEYAARVLGYAQKRRGTYRLLVENGSPRLAMIDTMVHEMTHIWQYINWNDKQIKQIYGEGTNRDIVYEGMAMWASIQYLYMIGETSYAMKQELIAERREDVYGVGFRLYREKYPFVKDFAIITDSPFTVFPPL